MDSFEILGYKINQDTDEKTIYSKYLGDTKFIVVLDKKDGEITKYANDFRKIVEVLPDKDDVIALKAYLENKTKE